MPDGSEIKRGDATRVDVTLQNAMLKVVCAKLDIAENSKLGQDIRAQTMPFLIKLDKDLLSNPRYKEMIEGQIVLGVGKGGLIRSSSINTEAIAQGIEAVLDIANTEKTKTIAVASLGESSADKEGGTIRRQPNVKPHQPPAQKNLKQLPPKVQKEVLAAAKITLGKPGESNLKASGSPATEKKVRFGGEISGGAHYR